MGWNALEPAPGRYSSSLPAQLRAVLRAPAARHARRRRRRGHPAWASGSRDTAAPPRDDAAFAAFLAHIARRFGGRISAYEIGDEEDDRAHWAGSVAQYVALLRSAYGAIKGADRHATVILGGLAGNDYRYLDAVYAAGGGRYFDAVAVHTDDACDVTAPTVYARDRGTRMVNRWYFLGVSSVHAVMAAHHDGRQADLHDRDRLVVDRRRVHDRALGGPEARRRQRGAPGRVPDGRLPLPRPAAASATCAPRCGSRSTTTARAPPPRTTTAC